MNILSTLTALYVQLSETTKANPILAGVVSLWGLSVVTFVIRGVPSKIWNFIYEQSTTMLVMNNEDSWSRDSNYNRFSRWYQKHGLVNFTRALILKEAIEPGYGQHFFFYKRHLFFFNRVRIESQGTSFFKEEVRITMLGRNKKIVSDLASEFIYTNDDKTIRVYSFSKEWNRTAVIQRRPIESVIIEAELKAKIVSIIEAFYKKKEWYLSRGLPYKETFVFHGIPGTGKTSLIKALACYFGRDIYVLSPGQMSGSDFEKAIATLPPGSFCLIEDFDSSTAVKKRTSFAKMAGISQTSTDSVEDAPGKETVATTSKRTDVADAFIDDMIKCGLSTILNTLDGVIGLNDTLIFMTTNCLDDIDPALLRKGRVDYIFEIKPLTHKEICEYISIMFAEEYKHTGNKFRDIPGCDLQGFFKDFPDSRDDFIKAIPRCDHA